MYSPIAVRPIPTDRAITRSLNPQAYFRRRTSRTFRIGNLSAGIRPPLANCNRRTVPGSDCRQRSPNHPINRVVALIHAETMRLFAHGRDFLAVTRAKDRPE